MIKLRRYQVEAVEAAHRAHAQGVRRPAEVMATGAGKSLVIANVAKTSVHGVAGGKRVVIIAHRHELVEQNAQHVRDAAPDLRVGIVKAGRNETQAHVISASVQTLTNPDRLRQLRDVGLVVYDEAHHVSARTSIDVMTALGCLGPERPGGAVALGMTATMVRGDKLALGDVWQDIVYAKDTAELIAEGYLVRPRGIRVRVEDLDLSRVRKVAGDWSNAGLGQAVEESTAPKKIAEAMLEHAADRQTILFAPLVHTAEVIRDALRAAGFTAEVVSGKTPKDERTRILDEYRAGRVQVLCNAMVFTEGTDLPMTSCIVLARPTENPGLFLQMLGRGLRLWAAGGKTDCVLLDLVDATGRHKLTLPVELFGEETLGEKRERRCDCPKLDEPCRCRVDGCGDDCRCGGGLLCGCVWDAQAEVDEALGLGGDDLGEARPGTLVSDVVDLFEGADSGWLRTYGGVWFRATAQRYVAVLPRVDGGYGVVTMHKATVGDSRWVAGCERVSELSYAMAHASGEVAGQAPELIEGRARSTLLHYARQWGLADAVTANMSLGELRKLLVVGQGSARIDRNLPGWVRR